MDQQTKVGEILTNDAGAPTHGGSFTLALDSVVPEQAQLRPVPSSVDAIAPQFSGRNYMVVDEQIAVVDPQSRKSLRCSSGGEARANR